MSSNDRLAVVIRPFAGSGQSALPSDALSGLERVRELAIRRKIGRVSEIEIDREPIHGFDCAWFTVQTENESHAHIVLMRLLHENLQSSVAKGIGSETNLLRYISGTLLE